MRGRGTAQEGWPQGRKSQSAKSPRPTPTAELVKFSLGPWCASFHPVSTGHWCAWQAFYLNPRGVFDVVWEFLWSRQAPPPCGVVHILKFKNHTPLLRKTRQYGAFSKPRWCSTGRLPVWGTYPTSFGRKMRSGDFVSWRRSRPAYKMQAGVALPT